MAQQPAYRAYSVIKRGDGQDDRVDALLRELADPNLHDNPT